MASRSPKLSRASRVTRRPLLAACSAKGKRAKAVDMLTHERLLLEEVEGVDFRILDRMARFGSLAGMSRVRSGHTRISLGLKPDKLTGAGAPGMRALAWCVAAWAAFWGLAGFRRLTGLLACLSVARYEEPKVGGQPVAMRIALAGVPFSMLRAFLLAI